MRVRSKKSRATLKPPTWVSVVPLLGVAYLLLVNSTTPMPDHRAFIWILSLSVVSAGTAYWQALAYARDYRLAYERLTKAKPVTVYTPFIP